MILRSLVVFIFAMALPCLADPVSLSEIVARKDYAAASRLAAAVARAAGRDYIVDLPHSSSVKEWEKLSGRLIVTDQPLLVTNLQSCVVLTTAPLSSGAYISDCLIISSSTVTAGSYLTGSTVLTKDKVQVGSYSEDNVIQAALAAVGSHSSGSTYYNVKPFIGKPGSADETRNSDALSNLVKL